MRQKINQFTAKLSLFWRYFFLLAAVVLVFLGAFTVATRQFTRTLQDSYLEQARSSFEKNAELFARDVSLAHSLPMSMEDTQQYLTVANAPQPLDTPLIFAMSEMSNSFMLQCLLLDLPAEGFVYFKDNQVCLTRHRIFTDAESCFDSYLIYNDMQGSILDILDQKSVPRSSRMLPAGTISVGGRTGTYLTLLVQSTSKEAVYGFLYPVDTVLEYFQIDALPANTYFQLTHADGTVLFAHGNENAEGEDYIQLTSQLPVLSCTASIGIPQSYFRAIIRSAQTAAQVIFLLSVVIGIAMCFFFSHISVRPFRQLIQDHTTDQTPQAPANELIAIDHFLKSAREKNVALRSMLLSSLLVRAFSGLTIPEEEYKKISDAFPMFRQSLRAAVVRDRTSEHAMEEGSAMITLLRQSLPEQFLCEYINIQESIVLFPADSEFCDLLQNVMLDLNAGPEGDGRFVCGISAPFLGVEEIGAAIRQAQFCIPESAERMIVQVAQEGAGAEDTAADLDLKQFQKALACWDQQEVLAQIEQMAAFAGKNSRVKPQELFYSILFLLRETAQAGKMSFEEHEKMTYEPTSSPVANLRRLKGIVNDLFEQKAALQMSDKQLLCEEIVQYIRNNYSDATLCMASLSKQFCVSERFAYNAVMEITGMNMSNFMAQCRMQEAARLLRDTDENVSSIAEKCGYPVESTFYRNFKKYYHMTPADYKSTH